MITKNATEIHLWLDVDSGAYPAWVIDTDVGDVSTVSSDHIFFLPASIGDRSPIDCRAYRSARKAALAYGRRLGLPVVQIGDAPEYRRTRLHR